MEVLIYLVPLALALGFVGLLGFLWALNSGQYDDLDGAAWRALADDEPDEAPVQIVQMGQRNSDGPRWDESASSAVPVVQGATERRVVARTGSDNLLIRAIRADAMREDLAIPARTWANQALG
ncbi:cbb3-type cytochrome oxidase maturation protein [Bradyrhizobium sp. USDA 4451]